MNSPATRLYTQEILSLATGLAAWPLDPAMPFQGSDRSPACGSTLSMSLALGADQRIDGIGLRTQACAIGQASAAIFAQAALGLTAGEVQQAGEDMAAWLKNAAPLPDWPGLAAIEPALAYPARHGAILLAWRAAQRALSSVDTAR
ncbi:MAG: iron-sulfur cluster assembly scaffold protein [Novosphingobium sp.]